MSCPDPLFPIPVYSNDGVLIRCENADGVASGGGGSAGGQTTGAGGGGATGGDPPEMCPCPAADCYTKCQDADKEKQKQCTELNKAHSENMKTLGCPGTKCSTKPIGKACRKKTAKCAPKKRKCAPKKKRCPPSTGPRMTRAEVATIKWIIGGRRGPCP